ncbi:hypothetical protein DFP73DRAFT_360429 [Morchella snyderi]|nr:hypothetical protein DFP73DRAFT_360429 [Morchella snyderi]
MHGYAACIWSSLLSCFVQKSSASIPIYKDKGIVYKYMYVYIFPISKDRMARSRWPVHLYNTCTQHLISPPLSTAAALKDAKSRQYSEGISVLYTRTTYAYTHLL